MKQKLSGGRRRAGIITLVLAVAILVTGTLAWQAISQRAVNNVAGEILPAGARLHDDFGLEEEPDFTQPLNKDVYVENYSGQNPLNTDDAGEPVFVRVKLMEYMEMGVGAGLFDLTGSDPSDYQTLDQVDAGGTRVEDPANNATSLVAGASILNLSTWRTHIEDDLSNPFASYWTWTMGGTKAFMPTFNKDNTSLLTDRTDYAHDKYEVGDKENGTALYSNPTYNNNPEEHTAKNTLTTAGIVSMDEWMNDLNHPTAEAGTGNGYWVGDSDGWYYWSKGLEPGESTALLLDQITLTGTIEGEFYYGIHVISEMATAGDWGDETAETGFYKDGLTEDGKYLLDQAAGSSTKGKKLLHAPMDDTGSSIPTNMLVYAPMDGVGPPSAVKMPNLTDSVTDTTFTVYGANITGAAESKVGTGSAHFSGVNGERINANIPSLNLGTNDFTVSFWANPDTQANTYPLFFCEDSNIVFDFMCNDPLSGNEITIALGGSYTRIINTDTTYTPGVWAHYAVVRKDGVLTIYLDGQNIGSTSSYTDTPLNMSNFSIGGNSAPGIAYTGYIDDFAIYDYAKYTSDFTPSTAAQTDASLLYMDFDETITNQTSLHEVISNSDFTNVTNAEIIGKANEYKFGGSSLYFSGNNYQRINIQNADLNLGTNDFTISFWANPDTQVQPYALFFGEDSNVVFDFMTNDPYSGNEIAIAFGGSFARIINTDTAYTPGVWAHYAVVRKDGVFTIYLNGQGIGSTSSYTTAPVNMSNFSIGGDGAINTAYKGYIDDFAIYSYAKYDGDFTPPTVTADVDPANIHTEGLEIVDDVTGNDFTVLGSANMTGTDTQKKFGDASLYFPGTIGQRINIQNQDLNFGTKDFTVSLWAYPEASQPLQWSLLFGNDTNGTFDFFLEWDNGPIGLRGYNAALLNFINANKNFTPNVWTHYAVVRKEGVFTIYENGINIGSTSSFTTADVNLSNLSIGGNDHSGTAFKGYMDDFSIYNYAVWESDFTPPTTAGTP